MNNRLLRTKPHTSNHPERHYIAAGKDDWRNNPRNLTSSYPFASYAATCWVDHFALASVWSSAAPGKRRNLKLLLSPGSDSLGLWTKVLWYRTGDREGAGYPTNVGAGSGSAGFPWASAFTPEQVELIGWSLLEPESPSKLEVGLDVPAGEKGEGVSGSDQEKVKQGDVGGDQEAQRWNLLPRDDKSDNTIAHVFRGRNGRAIVLALIIVLLIIGAAAGGSQTNK